MPTPEIELAVFAVGLFQAGRQLEGMTTTRRAREDAHGKPLKEQPPRSTPEAQCGSAPQRTLRHVA